MIAEVHVELTVDDDEALAAELVEVHDLLAGADVERGGEPVELLEFADGNGHGQFAGEQ